MIRPTGYIPPASQTCRLLLSQWSALTGYVPLPSQPSGYGVFWPFGGIPTSGIIATFDTASAVSVQLLSTAKTTVRNVQLFAAEGASSPQVGR